MRYAHEADHQRQRQEPDQWATYGMRQITKSSEWLDSYIDWGGGWVTEICNSFVANSRDRARSASHRRVNVLPDPYSQRITLNELMLDATTSRSTI